MDAKCGRSVDEDRAPNGDGGDCRICSTVEFPRRLILINILTGIARGVGIAIGVTIFTATIVYLLQKLGALNLPVVGDFIAEIVRIVQAQLELDGRKY